MYVKGSNKAFSTVTQNFRPLSFCTASLKEE